MADKSELHATPVGFVVRKSDKDFEIIYAEQNSTLWKGSSIRL